MKKFVAYAAVGLGVVGYNVMTNADRDASGAIIDGGDVDPFSMRLGDCFDNTRSFAADEAGQVSTLPGVPCSEPHDNEVFAIFDVDIESFPGDEPMAEMAFDQCLARFENFVGLEYESSVLDITALYPSSSSWAQDDREVICAIYEMNGEKLTGSAKNTAI
ncbi:MAG: hypothetical protein HKN65_08755 [Woeseiaceae bacterium]|nr:hypothetical protein [Woeseiaceae bacterium]